MLFKMAVHSEIESDRTDHGQKKMLSINHQVLCDLTAIVGVQKQADKATGELVESTIKFEKELQQRQSDNSSADR